MAEFSVNTQRLILQKFQVPVEAGRQVRGRHQQGERLEANYRGGRTPRRRRPVNVV